MNPNLPVRLPTRLEAAVQHVKLAARAAAERTVESLGLAALAANNAFQRDALLGAQFELNRKSAIFALTFNDVFDQRVLREIGLGQSATAGATAWDALSLVEDREVEIKVAAERFGLEISHSIEWELRELDAYVGSVLGLGRAEHDRNPLRPEVIATAMLKGVEAVSERSDVRRALEGELSRSLAALLRQTYAEIIAELRKAGVQPAGMAVKTMDSRVASGWDMLDRQPAPREEPPASTGGGLDSRAASRRSTASVFGPSTRSGSATMGSVDPALMGLIRRLAFVDPHADSGHGGWAEATGTLPPNLIRAHRDELRQASTGNLDHMVIDVVGSLFDQILSDPKVAPQMARQIARLQLPVLRAALGDPSFFSSRRHPVRRFVNRIASLGVAFDDFEDERAKAFLAKVRGLVQEVVQGDFDQIEVYDRQLDELERFVAEQAAAEVRERGDPAALLSEKEDELRLRQMYSQQLHGALKALAGPEFVRDFIARVWSQVLLKAATRDGRDSERVQRLRHTARELFMSVQPKTSPAARKVFLAELPKLMQEVNEGMDLIGWPEAARRGFFGQLLPAHAESLKNQAFSQLDFNLLARQVETALTRPLPSREDLASAPKLPVLEDEVIVPRFSAEEAARVGLVEESAVDWDGKVDIDLSEDADTADGAPAIDGLPAPNAAEPAEPTRGRTLADHVQIGFAYQMHLEGDWKKVRLTHVSAGRTFFVFTHGQRHQRTISLTYRMLARLCETGRMRAFENALLLERATARARRQLAAVGA